MPALYKTNTNVYVLTLDLWQEASIQKANSNSSGITYEVLYTTSHVVENHVEECRIFPLQLHLKDIINKNTVNLITPTGSVVDSDNAHAKDNNSVHEFRATTPSQPRYAEMFLNMKHDMERMKQTMDANKKKFEAILQGPIRKQQENLEQRFDWENFDALSSFSEPFSIDGNLESIDSNSNDKKMEEVNNEVHIKKRLRKRKKMDPGPFISRSGHAK